ncbi:hypothetical protein FRC05_000443 [Tulasnella sp. 425]|nr:hypothetical protein FRC05_000443 [Tulasnella sp. 425]
MPPKGDGIKPGLPEHLKRGKSNARTFSEASSLDAAALASATPASRTDQLNEDVPRKTRPPATYSVPPDRRNETDEIVRISFGEVEARRAVPTRLLDNFVIFDTKDGNSKASLSEFLVSQTTAGRQDFRAYGEASAYSSDIALEHDDAEDAGADYLQSQPVALTTIVAISAQYGSSSGLEIWVVTEHAWYRLGHAEKSYRFKYAPFWKRHFLVHAAVYAVLVNGLTQAHDVLDFVEQATSPEDKYLLREHPWTRAELNGLVSPAPSLMYYSAGNDRLGKMGTLGPELRAYAQQHFREEDERRDFLSIPIICKLVGNPEETTLPETATSVSRAPPRPRHTRSSSAPVIHMMPFTGKLAHKLFSANFKIHHPPHQAKSSETREERETNKGVAEDILERQDQMHSITRSVVPKAAANRSHGNVREVEIEGIGRFRIGGFALLNGAIPGPKDDRPPDEVDPTCKSPNNIVNEFGIIFIRDILQENGKWRFHGQVLRPASQTVLRELAHSRELVFTRTCLGKLRPDQFLCPIEVEVVKNDSDFVEPPDERCDSVGFFTRYGLGYNDTFLPLAEDVLDHTNPRLAPELWMSCPCMKSITQQDCAQPTLFRYRASAADDGRSPFVLMLRDQVYHINDFVFIVPQAPYASRPVGMRDAQWQKSDPAATSSSAKIATKGELVPHKNQLFSIGQIISLEQWFVRVRMLGRYEDLARTTNQGLDPNQPQHFIHFDRLYFTHEERRYESTELAGICHVRHAQEIQGGVQKDAWASIDGFRTSHQLRPDTDPNSPLTLASVQELPIANFVSASPEVLQQEDEEMEAIRRFPGRRDIRCYDLFHGAGGWSSGFATLGWDVVGGVDIDPDASATSPKHPSPGDVDLLLAGPPCQDFSGLNRYKSNHDNRKALVSLALTIAEHLQPKYVMLENVVPLLNATLKPPAEPDGSVKHGVHKYVLRCLTGLGYNVRWKIYDSANFGAPQTHLDVGVMDEWDLQPRGAPHNPLTVRDAVEDLPAYDWKAPEGREDEELEDREPDVALLTCEESANEDSKAAGLEAQGRPDVYRSHPQNDYQLRLRKSSDDTPLQHVTRIRLIGRGPEADHRQLPYALQLPGLNDPANVAAKRANYFPGLYGNIFTLSIPWVVLILNHVLTGRVQWDGLFQTVVTQLKPGNKQGRCLHPDQKRVLSVRECARAQGFPDDMKFCSGDDDPTDMYRQIGNAVPVPLSEALARELRRTLLQSQLDNNARSSPGSSQRMSE